MRQRPNLIGKGRGKESEEAGGRTQCFLEGEENPSKLREALFHTGNPSEGSGKRKQHRMVEVLWAPDLDLTSAHVLWRPQGSSINRHRHILCHQPTLQLHRITSELRLNQVLRAGVDLEKANEKHK